MSGNTGTRAALVLIWSIPHFWQQPVSGGGVAQFFYGADSLDNDVWQPRDLTDYGFGNADKYMTLALEAALRL